MMINSKREREKERERERGEFKELTLALSHQTSVGDHSQLFLSISGDKTHH